MVNPLTISYRYTYKVVEFRQIAYQASRGVLEPLHHRLNPSVHLHTPLLVSLRTRPSKNLKRGSGKSAGVEVYIVPGMQVHF